MIPSKDDSNISLRVSDCFKRLEEALAALESVVRQIKADALDVRHVDELVSDADHLMMVVQQYRSLLKDAAATIFATLSEQDG